MGNRSTDSEDGHSADQIVWYEWQASPAKDQPYQSSLSGYRCSCPGIPRSTVRPIPGSLSSTKRCRSSDPRSIRQTLRSNGRR